jgi:hypothetical protein
MHRQGCLNRICVLDTHPDILTQVAAGSCANTNPYRIPAPNRRAPF